MTTPAALKTDGIHIGAHPQRACADDSGHPCTRLRTSTLEAPAVPAARAELTG